MSDSIGSLRDVGVLVSVVALLGPGSSDVDPLETPFVIHFRISILKP